MRRLFSACLAIVITVSLSGCFGTMIKTPAAAGNPFVTTQVHILAFPTQVDAHMCNHGIAESLTYVPLWGLVVGVLTIGIVVPTTTSWSCVPSSS